MKLALERVKDFFWETRRRIHNLAVKIVEKLKKAHLAFHIPQWLTAIICLAPALTVIGIFTLYPIVNSFLVSFYDNYNIYSGEIDGYTLIGNYVHIFQRAGLVSAISNTALIVVISVPLTIILGLAIAACLNAIKPLRGFFQTIFFLPYVTNTIAIGLVFAFLFLSPGGAGGTTGLVNSALSALGVKPVAWLGIGATYASALTVILVYTVWNGLAFKIIVFLAGIQGIDKQYYDAASIDGASKMKTFSRITVPLISPMIFYILITSVIGAFKTYSSIVAIIGEKGVLPNGAHGEVNLKTIVFYIYDYLQQPTGLDGKGQMGYASAAAIILFGIILVFTIIQMAFSKKRVHY
jgi:multiple sugar transport system permease protein